MRQNIFGIKVNSGFTGLTSDDLFRISLNNVANIEPVSNVDYYWNRIGAYARQYALEPMFEAGGEDQNLIYERYLNNRFHIPVKQLKYYANISDIWYMNALYCGLQSTTSPQPWDKIKIRCVSLQSFANINLGVDSIIIALQNLLPAGKTLEYGNIPAANPGIRLVFFIDKMELVDRKIGANTITNLQFHYTIKAYLIDPAKGGQYKDFGQESLLSTKSFYFEQTVPTLIGDNFVDPKSVKTGWGHFIYPVYFNPKTVKYIQLQEALKVIYNSMYYSQNTNNASLKVNSIVLRDWLNVNIDLRNALDDYEPDCIEQTQNNNPAFAFADTNVLKNWLVTVKDAAVQRYAGVDPGIDFILSYDNIYWEPLNDSYPDGIYSDSPAMFMTRLTSYYEGLGDTPIDEPGNFEFFGGFVKSRRKYFLANLILEKLPSIQNSELYMSTNGEAFADYINEEYFEKFMGSKFFPLYRFKQWKNDATQKELLDLITIPFTGSPSSTNIIEAETSQDLKRLVSPFEVFTPYRKKIITNPDNIPNAVASTSTNPFPSTTQKINALGYVYYYSENSVGEEVLNVVQLSAQSINDRRIFAFLIWPFANVSLITGYSQWTRRGRYRILATNIEIINPNVINDFTSKTNPISLCTTMTSGMYETTEEAYKKWKSIISNPPVYIYGNPSPTDPLWEDYYTCLGTAEIIEEVVEYCDPSPSPDGKQVVRRKGKQKYTVSASGVKTAVGDPAWYEYPTTTFVDNNATETYANGVIVYGKRSVVYQDCAQISSTFVPNSTQPTGPTVPTGPTGPTNPTSPIVTTPVTSGPTGPIGPTVPLVTGVNVSFEEFINPAVFKRNILELSPSDRPIPILVDKAFYVFKFKKQDEDEPSSRYTIKLSPGIKGQVLVFEINTFNPRHNGVILYDRSILTNDKSSQRVYLSTPSWGDGGGQPFISFLFLIFDGKNWVEFLRRDIY